MSDALTIPARPTLYRGIRMRSRLEADYAASLDRQGWEWKYEPECFADPTGQWLPDFFVARPGEEYWVEVKPSSLLGRDGARLPMDRINPILRKMQIARSTNPDAWLQLSIWEYEADESPLSLTCIPGTESLFPGGWLVRVPGIGIPFAWPWLEADNGS